MEVGNRALVIRRVAYVLGAIGLVTLGLAVASPSTFGIGWREALLLGTAPIAVNLGVALELQRRPQTPRLPQLALLQVAVATVAASTAVGMAGARAVNVLLALVVVFVFSGTVLPPRPHATVVVVGVALAATSAAIGGTLTAEVLTALVLVAGLGAVTGAGARLHAVELQERDAATRSARRSARSLDAAVEGILHATSTDPDEITDAVVRAAARLVEGGAVLYVLGDEGQARPAASCGLPPGLDELDLPATEGVVGQVLQTGTSFAVHAHEADDHGRIHRLLGLETLVVAPIRVNGLVVGALLGGRAEATAWADEERDAFALLAQHAGRALELSDEAAADRRMLARMAELDRMKDDVVTTVSHELRTPVTVIAGLAETLARRGDVDATLRDELVQRLWANGVALAQIVEQLLDAALLRRGELVPAPEPVPVSHVVDRATTRLSPLMSAHRVEVEVPGDLAVLADPVLVERVVDNVLLNALRHTPPGTTVRISARSHGQEAEIAVEDDGPGIATKDLDRILERFERAGDPGERSRGMGIGLSLASEILRAHGSTMLVRSGIGQGARFAFRLPTSSTAGDPANERLSR